MDFTVFISVNKTMKILVLYIVLPFSSLVWLLIINENIWFNIFRIYFVRELNLWNVIFCLLRPAGPFHSRNSSALS